MDLIPVSLKLPEDMLHAANVRAQEKDVSVGQLVGNVLLRDALKRPRHPKAPNRADEALFASLRTLLAADVAEADGWLDTQARLRAKGYEFRPAGGGVTLYRACCGTRLCKGSELGFSYSSLVRRFGCAMPDHPHGDLSGRASQPDSDGVERV